MVQLVGELDRLFEAGSTAFYKYLFYSRLYAMPTIENFIETSWMWNRLETQFLDEGSRSISFQLR